MAKLTVTLDTETKEYVVTVNGVDIPNVQNVEAYQYGTPGERYHEVHFSLAQYENTEGVSKTTRLYATEAGKTSKVKQPYSQAQLDMIEAYKNRFSK